MKGLRTLRRRLPLAIAAIIVLFVFPAISSAGSTEGISIHLQYGSFDPLRGEPVFPAGETLQIAAGDPSMILLQFNGPVQAAWKSAVEALGVQLYGYVPDYTFIARAEAKAAEGARELPFVRWIGVLQPAYRLSSQLQDASLDPVRTQEVVVRAIPDADLAKLAKWITSRGGQVEEQSASAIAASLRVILPNGLLGELARQDGVTWIEPYFQPGLLNDVSTETIMHAQSVRDDLSLYGSGQIVAVADTGLDAGEIGPAMSDDFEGRIEAGQAICQYFGKRTTWYDANGHGTHVSGSVLGSGVLSGADPGSHQYAGSFAGVAPEAKLVIQSVDDAPTGGLECVPDDLVNFLIGPAFDAGARIHSNSWGGPTGGSASNPQYGGYNSLSAQADEAAWTYPSMLILYAAGNSGKDLNGDGVIDRDSLNSPGTAKNALTVGASESLRNKGGYNPGGPCSSWGSCFNFNVPPLKDDPLSDNSSGMAAFSSRGPTDDGRIKPDLVAPGTNIVSDRSHNPSAMTGWGVYDENYIYLGGTSMATPLTAGAAALAREWLVKFRQILEPSGALVKAVLINGADDMTPGQYPNLDEVPKERPNPVSGWGRVDLAASLDPANPQKILVKDETTGLQTGESLTYTVTAGPVQEIGASAAIKDYAPPAALAPGALPDPGGSSSGAGAASPMQAEQILQNHGFESGEWTPWLKMSSNTSLPALDNQAHHSGAWSAALGNDLGSEGSQDLDSIIQEVAIPAETSGLKVDFWYRLNTEETEKNSDFFCFGMWYLDGSVAWGHCFVDIGASGSQGWTEHSYSLPGNELAAVAGSSVYFGFQASNNSLGASQVWVDDTALEVTPGGAGTPQPEVSGGPLRITLAWTDYPGQPNAASALVNDLDLEVIGPDGTHYYGNAGLYGSGSCLREGRWDACNNVEGVLVPSALYGQYQLIVHGANIPDGPQPFALVASGDDLAASGDGLVGKGDHQQDIFLPLLMRQP